MIFYFLIELSYGGIDEATITSKRGCTKGFPVSKYFAQTTNPLR